MSESNDEDNGEEFAMVDRFVEIAADCAKVFDEAKQVTAGFKVPTMYNRNEITLVMNTFARSCGHNQRLTSKLICCANLRHRRPLQKLGISFPSHAAWDKRKICIDLTRQYPRFCGLYMRNIPFEFELYGGEGRDDAYFGDPDEVVFPRLVQENHMDNKEIHVRCRNKTTVHYIRVPKARYQIET